jgi:hypothetical protein
VKNKKLIMEPRTLRGFLMMKPVLSVLFIFEDCYDDL